MNPAFASLARSDLEMNAGCEGRGMSLLRAGFIATATGFGAGATLLLATARVLPARGKGIMRSMAAPGLPAAGC